MKKQREIMMIGEYKKKVLGVGEIFFWWEFW